MTNRKSTILASLALLFVLSMQAFAGDMGMPPAPSPTPEPTPEVATAADGSALAEAVFAAIQLVTTLP